MYFLMYLQAIFLGTKPILLAAIANYSSSNETLATKLSPEILSELLKFCLSAAAHSLNIIFALREQNMIGKLVSCTPIRN